MRVLVIYMYNYTVDMVLLPCVHVQRVKQSVCSSVVVVVAIVVIGMKIARSRILGTCTVRAVSTTN